MTTDTLDSHETEHLIDAGVPRKTDWRELAACKGQTKLFFGKKAERPQARERREAQARMLCQMCVVQKPCRQFARSNREYGFWGGENEEDRYVAGYPVTAAIGVRTRLQRENDSASA